MNKPEIIEQTSIPEKPKSSKRYTVHNFVLIIHFFTYIAVMALLILIWSFIPVSFFFPIFSILGWGIGVGLHLITFLIYFDKIPFLTKIQEQSTFRILFIYHTFIYVMANLIVLSADLITPGVSFFYWPLSMWGIGLILHCIGFFTWDVLMKNVRAKIIKKHPDYERENIKRKTSFKIFNLWILIVHITYYIVVNTLIYTVFSNLVNIELGGLNITDRTISWSGIIILHIISYLLYYYNESLKHILKGAIIHTSLYIVSNSFIIYQWIKSDISYFWPIYSIILWGICVYIHILTSIKHKTLTNNALIKVSQYNPDADEYSLYSKARELLFRKLSFISHLIIYVIGILLISINLIVMNVDLRIIIHPIMGWGIGVSVHVAIYLILIKKIKDFWKRTFRLNLAAYIPTIAYLIILNVMLGGFPWSIITMLGWGIGVSVHVAIYLILIKKIKGFWKRTFRLHLAAYIPTIAFLIILNVMLGGFPWSIITMLGWGIGFGIHAILAYVR